MKFYDTLIVGAGPAGLSAAIYASRAMLHCAVLEQAAMAGGQMINTPDIDNYPGIPSIDGFTLSDQMRKHAAHLGTTFLTDRLLALEPVEGGFKLCCQQSTYLTRTVILATGARHRLLGAEGETRLTGHGVSYCAACDGAFFRNRTVAVVGGGNTAAEDALYLARFCQKVYLIHRRDRLRANRVLSRAVLENSNIQPLWNTQVLSIEGDQQVTGLRLNTEQILPVDGIFVAIGMQPNSEPFAGIVKTDDYGFVCADETCTTSVPGIFAAGDLRTKKLRQIVTAVSDGACAITAVEEHLRNHFGL